MKKYYIYHIPGVKIGCSTQPARRVEAQGYTEYEILEVHTDVYEISKREKELQKQYGYKVDRTPYWSSIKNRHRGFKDPSAAGKKGYETIRKYAEENQRKFIEMVRSRTPEEVREHNKKVSDKMMQKGTHPSQKVVVCPYCSKEIRGAGPAKRHENKCKLNDNIGSIIT